MECTKQSGCCRSAVFLVAVMGTVLFGCGLQESRARRLDAQITEGTRQLQVVGAQFGANLRPFLAGEIGDTAALRAAHLAMAAQVLRLQTELDAIEPPRLSDAEAYRAEYARFLRLEQEFVKGPYAELLELLSASSTTSPQALDKVNATVRDAAFRERQALEDLREARARFQLARGS